MRSQHSPQSRRAAQRAGHVLSASGLAARGQEARVGQQPVGAYECARVRAEAVIGDDRDRALLAHQLTGLANQRIDPAVHLQQRLP